MNRHTLGSVALMFAAMSLIPLGDGAGKLLTGAYGADPIFVAFARFAVGAAMVVLMMRERVAWWLYRDWRIWLRAALIAGGIGSILTALRSEPMANVFGAFFVGPLISYGLSAWLLREPVRPAQTALVMLGFCGVLLVVRPGFGMTPGLAFAVLAGVFYGSFLTMSRWLASIAPPRQLMLTQTVLGTLILAPFGLAGAMPALDATVVGLLLVSGIASASGNLILILAYRRAGGTVLAPFVYFQLISATALGWAIFGDWPDAATLAGLVLLTGAGFGTLAVRR